jgi:predicted Zn finger-like uncharacterized protein
MIAISCPSCNARYKIDESKLAGPRARAKCPKCQTTFEVAAEGAAPPVTPPSVTTPGESTAVSKARARSAEESTARAQRMRSDEDVGGQTITTSRLQAAGMMELPADKKYSLAVLDGRASGQIFQIVKTRTVIGRAGCDITLDDPECSRQHAVVEVMGSRVTVSDLKSTNGTFVDGKRIDQANLENQTEFRVGEHVFMLIITERE